MRLVSSAMDTDNIKQLFARRFGRAPAGVVAAPGRVNLIGEHTDYNDGFVLPIAIGRRTLAAWAPRDDGRCCFASAQQDKPVEVDLCEPIAPGELAWGNYPLGVVAGLVERGLTLVGADVLFDSDVPLNAGLSSSASLEVASALALLAACGQQVPDEELALLCQRAENVFAGAPCGIMDQSISIMGQADCALLLDCRSLQTRQVPMNLPGVTLLVCDTQVSHDIGDGGYPARRSQCQQAASILGVRALRDTDLVSIDQAHRAGELDEMQFRRSRHVVTEIARTLEAAEVLETGQADAAEKFGQLMYASHESLRDDFEVSCVELDAIVATASKCDGVFGARMTGGGFGGCAIVLAKEDAVEAITKTIRADFAEKFGQACPIFATHPANGAGTIE